MARQPHHPDEDEPRVRRRRPTETDLPAGEVLVTDLRKTGWSWGWDTLAREFAGLLHQSGIGLYFTYATYTDNRKESPYRGSSYTGVEALSDFSGESADDVRTINKILAALGLARFETYTVYVPSKDGRRATRNRLHCYLTDRDPHLTSEDVLAVLRLALKDQRVYKHIRHVFRPSFRPIDRSVDATGAPREHPNPWYAILPAVKRTAEWRTLALKAERDHLALRERNLHGVEAAARRRQHATAAPETILPDSEDGGTTILSNTEDGGMVGDTEDPPRSSLPATEDAEAGFVPGTDGKHDQGPNKQTEARATTTKPGTTTTTRQREPRPGDMADAADAENVFALFSQANGRETTSVERDLLRRIISDFDGPARQHSPDHSGAVWVTAAIIEAVDAGSRFVSPRRVRLICQRWAKDGFQTSRGPVAGSMSAGDRQPSGNVPDVAMPNGQSSRTIWRRVIGIARGSLNADALIRFLEPCHIAAYDGWRREITIAVPDERTGEKLERVYRQLIERAFATIFGKTVRFQCVTAGETEEDSQQPIEELSDEDDLPASAGPAAPLEIEEDGFDPVEPEEDAASGEAIDEEVSGEVASPPRRDFQTVSREEAPSAGGRAPLPFATGAGDSRYDGPDTANRELWIRALDRCQDVSVLRRRLFEAYAVLAAREGREVTVVAANTFVADQLAECAPRLEAALGTLLGEDELKLTCSIGTVERR